MTLVWFEGFDSLDTATLGDFYTLTGGVVDNSPPAGRSGNALSMNAGSNSLTHTIPDNASWVIGMAIRKTASQDPFPFILTNTAGGFQCSIFWTLTNALEMRRANTTILETSTTTFLPNQWYYLEAKITVANAGSWEVKVNGVVELSGSGDTQAQSTDEVTRIRLEGENSNIIYWDDIYVLNQDGGAPWNDYLGDVTVTTLSPDANGTTNNWTPLSGNNFENVDESPHDSDTTYVSTSTVSDIDLYTFDDLSTTATTIFGVQHREVARKEGAGTRINRPVVRTGAANFEGDDFGLGDSYAGKLHMFEQNPDTVAQWTASEVDGLEAGVKVQS